VHSRVYGPACPTDRPHTHRWARRVFLNGKSDDARESMSTYACPCVHISARQASAHASCTDEFLRSRCAGDAPLVDAAATAVIAGAVAAVPAAAAPPPVAAPVPPRRVLAVATCVHARHRGPGSDPKRRICARVGLSFVVCCRRQPWGAGRPPGSASVRIGTRLWRPRCPDGPAHATPRLETVEWSRVLV
jgi:hypothetical protein